MGQTNRIYIVDAITDLVNVNVRDGERITVLGWSGVGDGGGGEFVYHRNSTATVDCGMIFDGVGGTVPTPGGSTSTGEGRFIRQASPGGYFAKWFGARGNGSFNDTTAIQKALDVAYANDGGIVFLGEGNFTITTSLVLGTGTNLVGAGQAATTITQSTSNTPIISVTKNGSINTQWSIKNLALTYPSSQTGANALGIKIGSTSISNRFWNISDVTISKVYRGISLPSLTGCDASAGKIENVNIDGCSNYGIYLAGDTSSGFRENLVLVNVWVDGNHTTNSRGFYINSCKGISLKGCGTTGLYECEALNINNSQCDIDVFSCLSMDVSFSEDTNNMFEFNGCEVSIGQLIANSNKVTISGSANFVVVRATDSAVVNIKSLADELTSLTDTSTGSYYTAFPVSNCILNIDNFEYSASASPAPNGNISDSTTYKKACRVFDNNVRTQTVGGKNYVYGSTAPTTGTWVAGDICWNNDPDAAEVIGWTCVTGGTPGTWVDFGLIFGIYDNGNVSGATTIDWNNGSHQAATLIGDTTLSFTDPINGRDLRLILNQDATGNRSVTWPNLDGADPVIATSGDATTVCYFYFDGTEYHTFTLEIVGGSYVINNYYSTTVSTTGCLDGDGTAGDPVRLLLSPTGFLECLDNGLAIDIDNFPITSGCVEGNGTTADPIVVRVSPTGYIHCLSDGLAIDLDNFPITSGCITGDGTTVEPIVLQLSPTGYLECRSDGLAIQLNNLESVLSTTVNATIIAGGVNDVLYKNVSTTQVGLSLNFNDLYGNTSLQSDPIPSGLIVDNTGLWIQLPKGDWLVDYGLNVSGDDITDYGNLHAILQYWDGGDWADINYSEFYILSPLQTFTASASRSVYLHITDSSEQYRIAATAIDTGTSSLNVHVIGGFLLAHQVN